MAGEHGAGAGAQEGENPTLHCVTGVPGRVKLTCPEGPPAVPVTRNL